MVGLKAVDQRKNVRKCKASKNGVRFKVKNVTRSEIKGKEFLFRYSFVGLKPFNEARNTTLVCFRCIKCVVFVLLLDIK